jgi:hypothetical protein
VGAGPSAPSPGACVLVCWARVWLGVGCGAWDCTLHVRVFGLVAFVPDSCTHVVRGVPGPLCAVCVCPCLCGVCVCRNKAGLGKKMYPVYQLYMKDGDKFLMAAKKRPKQKTSNYLISASAEALERDGDSFLGKLRSNFVGTGECAPPPPAPCAFPVRVPVSPPFLCRPPQGRCSASEARCMGWWCAAVGGSPRRTCVRRCPPPPPPFSHHPPPTPDAVTPTPAPLACPCFCRVLRV